MTEKTQTRCGFVAVIGAPNAGKSTLINHLVGGKVSIVSPKVQTTRTLVRGIAMHNNAQIILVDTPGIFEPEKKLERAMVAAAWAGESEADMVMLVVDSARSGKATDAIIRKMKDSERKKPAILVLNKTDTIKPPQLLALTQHFNDLYPFEATFMISALKGRGTEDVLNYLSKNIPEGAFHYPEDQMSDMPSRLLAAEITREKLFHALYQELPHALTVETESWEAFDNGSVKIAQTIYIERDTQKAIILGKGGQQIKSIGEASRHELEEILGQRIHLNLFVKVRENWADDPERLQVWGLDQI
jgi:GTP-binding protein Era